MKKTKFTKILSFILCFVLIAVVALSASGCSGNQETLETPNGSETQTQTTNPNTSNGKTTLGEGENSFDFTVIDKEGKTTAFIIKTDEKTVGDALQKLELIAGEESTYGLYVKTVNGQTLDYNTDGKYWAFYVNGEYAMSGVDTTEIKEGESYAFKAE